MGTTRIDRNFTTRREVPGLAWQEFGGSAMTVYNSVASVIVRAGSLLLEVVARVPFALWLGTRRRSRAGSNRVFIHIDEWGRITRVPR